jgi:hypothetical protein
MAKGSRDKLEERGRALDEAFYRSDPDPWRELRRSEAAAAEALAEASGLADPALLARLAGLGIRAETLAALTLIPLVEVAWADGKMDAREKAAVLSGAESTGIDAGNPSHGLLRLWLDDPPAPDLVAVWREFIAAVCRELTPDERKRLRSKVVDRARRVAEAAGGILGLGSHVSAEEEAVLADLGRAFPV